MRKKAYYLASCSTCQRILNEAEIGEEFEHQNIKAEPITEQQLDEMAALAGNYESLFSRRSMKYRKWGLHEKQLTEADYRKYILEEYTFLKRPVFLLGDQIFIGNTKKTVQALKEALK